MNRNRKNAPTGLEITVQVPLESSPDVGSIINKAGILTELLLVMDRAEKKWSSDKQTYEEHDDQRSPADWCEDIVCYAYWAKMMTRMESGEKFRKRMLQIAGLALHGVMSYDRLTGNPTIEIDPPDFPKESKEAS